MDKTIAGAGAGIASGIIIGLVSTALYLLNIAHLCLIAIGAGMFTRSIAPAELSIAYISGWMTHLAISMILGILLSYFLHITGRDYGLIKGLIFGSTVWFVDIALISPLSGFIPNPPDSAGLLILLGYHLLYGLLAAALILKFSTPHTLQGK